MYRPARRLALLVLLLPALAPAGVGRIGTPPDALPAAPRAAEGDAAARHRFQLRCWQHGRLLFEQYLTALPHDGSRYAIRLSGVDRHGGAVHVAEVDSATCLIRATGSKGD
jgi:hypothetical protein